MAQIHRFRNAVAIHIGSGETAYLTPKEAKQLAAQLNKCARDVISSDFIDSQFPVFSTEMGVSHYDRLRFARERRGKK